MSNGKNLTADDLAKISVSLSLVGYGLSLLSLEKADAENKDKESQANRLRHVLKRFK